MRRALGSAGLTVLMLVGCAQSKPRRLAWTAARVEGICPYPIAIDHYTADGLPAIDSTVTDLRDAQAVLKASEATLRSRYPNVTRLEVGPGYGRAWVGENGTANATVIAVHDYGIIVHLASQSDCPTGRGLTTAVSEGTPVQPGDHAVPLFFASP